MEGDETGYFILFRPAHETRIQSRQTLQTERQVLSSLQQQASRESGSGPASTLPLQRRVPVLPAEEIVLLQVGKAEVVSGTEIQNVAFSTGEMVIENLPEGVPIRSIFTGPQEKNGEAQDDEPITFGEETEQED